MNITLTDWVLLYCSIRRDDIAGDSYNVIREGGIDTNRTLYIQQFAGHMSAEKFCAHLANEFKRRGLHHEFVTRERWNGIYHQLEFQYEETGRPFDPFDVDGCFIA